MFSDVETGRYKREIDLNHFQINISDPNNTISVVLVLQLFFCLNETAMLITEEQSARFHVPAVFHFY